MASAMLQLTLIVFSLFGPHADPCYRLQGSEGVQLTAPSIPRPGQWLFLHVVSPEGKILSGSLSAPSSSAQLPVIWKAKTQEIHIRPLIAGRWYLHLVIQNTTTAHRDTIMFMMPVEYPPLPPWYMWAVVVFSGGGLCLVVWSTQKRVDIPYDETLY